MPNMKNKEQIKQTRNTPLLTKRESWVLEYLKQCYEKDYPISGGWNSPTNIGAAYGWFVLGTESRHSATGSPICKSLVQRGVIERNERGQYRWIPNDVKSDKPKKK